MLFSVWIISKLIRHAIASGLPQVTTLIHQHIVYVCIRATPVCVCVGGGVHIAINISALLQELAARVQTTTL